MAHHIGTKPDILPVVTPEVYALPTIGMENILEDAAKETARQLPDLMEIRAEFIGVGLRARLISVEFRTALLQFCHRRWHRRYTSNRTD